MDSIVEIRVQTNTSGQSFLWDELFDYAEELIGNFLTD